MRNIGFIFLLFLVEFTIGCNQDESDLFIISQNNKYGFINNTGQVVIQPTFSYVENFNEGLAYARIDSIIGFIDQKGKFRFENILEKNSYNPQSTSLFLRSTGYIKPFSEKNIRFSYIGFKPESENACFVGGLSVYMDLSTKKYGFINKKGKFVIPAEFDEAFKFNNGLALVKKNKKYGFINGKGELVIEPKFDNASSFSEGLSKVTLFRSDTTEGSNSFSFNTLIINTSGQIIKAPLGMVMVDDFHQGLAKTTNLLNIYLTGRGDNFIDTELNNKTEDGFEVARSFNEDYAAIKLNGKWGFVNRDFDTFIDLKYENAYDFHEGLAAVKDKNTWGYIDKNDNVVIEMLYDSCTFFNKGLAYVWLNRNNYQMEGYINKSGKVVWFKENH